MDRRRITISIDEELFSELHELVSFGFRNHLVNAILRIVLTAIRQRGEAATGAIIAGKFKLVPADE
jgi:metal-responsive CopG/Arc/MetJ family transcriptional regulator